MEMTSVLKLAGEDSEKIHPIPEACLDAFMDAVYALRTGEAPSEDFKVVYTPLNGTGNKPVREILKRLVSVQLCPFSQRAAPGKNGGH